MSPDVVIVLLQLPVLLDSKPSWNTVVVPVGGCVGVGVGAVVGDGDAVGLGVGEAVGAGVGLAVGRGVGEGVEVGLGVAVGTIVGDGVGFPDTGEVTVGKSMPNELYVGMLSRFWFCQTVLPTPMLAHCDRNWFSSVTVAVVKALCSL